MYFCVYKLRTNRHLNEFLGRCCLVSCVYFLGLLNYSYPEIPDILLSTADIAHTALTCVANWMYLINNFGNFAIINVVNM